MESVNCSPNLSDDDDTLVSAQSTLKTSKKVLKGKDSPTNLLRSWVMLLSDSESSDSRSRSLSQASTVSDTDETLPLRPGTGLLRRRTRSKSTGDDEVEDPSGHSEKSKSPRVRRWLSFAAPGQKPAQMNCADTPILPDTSSARSLIPPQAAVSDMEGGKYAGAMACVFYGTTACVLQVSNKVLFNALGVQCVFSFSIMQCIFNLCVMHAVATLGMFKIPPLSAEALLCMMPLSVLAVCNTAFGLIGLSYVSLPMYLGIRRLVTPTALLFEYIIWRRTQTSGIVASLIVLCLGSIVGGSFDVEFQPFGYACTLVANCFTVAYTMYMKDISVNPKRGVPVGIFQMLYYNSLMGLPVLALACAVSGEFQDIMANGRLRDSSLHVHVFLACALALTYQYSLFLCTGRNSPLATSVTGNFKDLTSSFLGLYIEGKWPSSSCITGLSLSLFGAYSYLWQKVRQ